MLRTNCKNLRLFWRLKLHSHPELLDAILHTCPSCLEMHLYVLSTCVCTLEDNLLSRCVFHTTSSDMTDFLITKEIAAKLQNCNCLHESLLKIKELSDSFGKMLTVGKYATQRYEESPIALMHRSMFRVQTCNPSSRFLSQPYFHGRSCSNEMMENTHLSQRCTGEFLNHTNAFLVKTGTRFHLR